MRLSRRLAAHGSLGDLPRHRRLGALGAALDRERAGRARRGTADVRLRRRDAAPDAALARAGPGRRDLPHPLPRRPLPRPARAAEDLRPDRPRGAADGLRPARPARPLQDAGPADRPHSASSSSWSSSSPARPSRHDGDEVRAFAVEHGVRACGYALVEEERPGRFDLEAAKRLGVPEGPAFAALQRGEEVEGAAGPVRPEEVMGEPRAGPHDRHHRRHRALPRHRRGRRRRRAARSTTPASPRRRPSAPPKPATRPSARPRRSPARPT